MRSALLGVALVAMAGGTGQVPAPAGVRLGERTWPEAEARLQADSLVVIPIGAGLEPHGPHLPLRTDLVLAEYFGQRLAVAAPVVVTPAVSYHHTPASAEYPGSASLTPETARDTVVQIIRALGRPGPRRFYAIPVGLSTTTAVDAAARVLAHEGVLLQAPDVVTEIDRLAAGWKQQPGGAHADELETSMMLFVDPTAVDMKRAVREFTPWNGPLTRGRSTSGTYSASGVWGDATVATREKGQYLVDGLIARMLQQIDALKAARLPVPQATPSLTAPRPAVPRAIGPTRVFDCQGGVERDIKRVEAAFNLHWANRDAELLAMLWSDQGDLVHPDGNIEKTRRTIYENRREQFKASEYRAARHSLAFGIIRCLNDITAIVDARWTLRDVTDASGATLPTSDGGATLVLQRAGENWPIEAYRYHVRPGAPPAPVWQKRPGPPDRR